MLLFGFSRTSSTSIDIYNTVHINKTQNGASKLCISYYHIVNSLAKFMYAMIVGDMTKRQNGMTNGTEWKICYISLVSNRGSGGQPRLAFMG